MAMNKQKSDYAQPMRPNRISNFNLIYVEKEIACSLDKVLNIFSRYNRRLQLHNNVIFWKIVCIWNLS